MSVESGLTDNSKLKDVVFGLGANTDSAFAKQFGVTGTFAPVCSYDLLSRATEVAKELNIDVKVGNFYTTDVFYNFDDKINRKWADLGAVAVEMESAGLYLTATACNKKALAICTISDLPLIEGCPKSTVEERENSFTDMIKIALEVAIRSEEV